MQINTQMTEIKQIYSIEAPYRPYKPAQSHFRLRPTDGFGSVSSSWSWCSGQGPLRTSYSPNHLLAAAAQIRPSIIVAPRGKNQLLAIRMASRLLVLLGSYVCVCVCLCWYVKGQGVLCISTLSLRECVDVSTGLWLSLEIEDSIKEAGFSQWLHQYRRCMILKRTLINVKQVISGKPWDFPWCILLKMTKKQHWLLHKQIT